MAAVGHEAEPDAAAVVVRSKRNATRTRSTPFQEIAKKTDADDGGVGIGVADLALFAFRKTLSVSQTRDPPNGPNERELLREITYRIRMALS